MCEKYNGWPNYATWLIDVFDLVDSEYLDFIELGELDPEAQIAEIANQIEFFTNYKLERSPRIVESLVDKILEDVDWHALASAYFS